MVLILTHEQEHFMQLCRYSSVDKVKEYYLEHINTLKDQLSLENNYLFRTTCHHGNLNVARWLRELGKIDIHIDNNNAFEYACYNNKLDVAKWLYSLSTIDTISEGIIQIKFLSGLSKCNSTDTMKWLLLSDYFHFGTIFRFLETKRSNEIEDKLPKSDFRFFFRLKVIQENLDKMLNQSSIMKKLYDDYLTNRPKLRWKIIKSLVSLLYCYNRSLRRIYQPDNSGYYEAKKSFERSLSHSS